MDDFLSPYRDNGGKKSSSVVKGPSCYLSHPVLQIGPGKIIGGNCSYPKEGASVYVGLDYAMADMRAYPWEETDNQITDIHFPITDMSVPKDPVQFKAMVTWLCNRLQEGATIHVGCVGGHGRTGMLLAAIVKQALGITDAITYVRKHYCKKAVETTEQIEFLQKHFGIKKVGATKSRRSSSRKLKDKYPGYEDWFGKTEDYGGEAKVYRGLAHSAKLVWSP